MGVTIKGRSAGLAISQHLLTKARALGLIDGLKDELKELNEVLWYAAPVTHPRANKRYGDFFFKVQGKELKDLFLVHCSTCNDTKKIKVFNQCDCLGAGCKKCRFKGEIPGSIPCPDC